MRRSPLRSRPGPSRLRSPALPALAAAVALLAAACGSSHPSSGGAAGGDKPTITYWSSDQGASVADDVKAIQPQLDAFTAQTGIKVKMEVIGWSDLLNRILAATSSGQGPDVVNIGNTWSTSLQATGAFLPIGPDVMEKIGDTGRFLPGALAATGAVGKDPVGVPLYSMAYALYYNKAMFAAAGITKAPATWDEFLDDARKLTHDGQWGLTVEGASTPENSHHAFALSAQQGGSFFDASGKPTFDTPQNVAGVKQFIDFVAADKIANPSDAEYSNGTEALKDFANGKAAMLMWQAATANLAKYGMDASKFGIAPIPFPATPPAGSQHVDSIVAGINLSVFANTKHQDAALQFVKFLTAKPAQTALNKAFGSLPSIKDGYDDPAFQTEAAKVIQDVLATSAAPMPAIPQVSQFQTVIGAAMKTLFADAASGKPITDKTVADQLDQAQQKMQAGG